MVARAIFTDASSHSRHYLSVCVRNITMMDECVYVMNCGICLVISCRILAECVIEESNRCLLFFFNVI